MSSFKIYKEPLWSTLIYADRFCTYVPAVSTVTGLTNITIKAIIKHFVFPRATNEKREAIINNRYYRHLNNTETFRTVVNTLSLGYCLIVPDLMAWNYRSKEGILKKIQDPKTRPAYIVSMADKDLLDDPEVMLALIKRQPACFQFASTRLKDNYEFLKMALVNNAYSYRDAGPNMRNNDDIALLVASQLLGNTVLTHGNTRFKDSENIALALCGQHYQGHHITAFSQRLQTDVAFMLRLLAKNARVYAHLSNQMKNNPLIKDFMANHSQIPGGLGEKPSTFKHFDDLKMKYALTQLKTSPAFEESTKIVNGDGSARSIFGFDKTTTLSKPLIGERFRKLVLTAHPDKNPNDIELAKALFNCVTSANEALKVELGEK